MTVGITTVEAAVATGVDHAPVTDPVGTAGADLGPEIATEDAESLHKAFCIDFNHLTLAWKFRQ